MILVSFFLREVTSYTDTSYCIHILRQVCHSGFFLGHPVKLIRYGYVEPRVGNFQETEEILIWSEVNALTSKKKLKHNFALKFITFYQNDIVQFTVNNLVTVSSNWFFSWYRIHKCKTNDRLDPLCEEIRKKRNITIDVTHGWVSIRKLHLLVVLLNLIFMFGFLFGPNQIAWPQMFCLWIYRLNIDLFFKWFSWLKSHRNSPSVFKMYTGVTFDQQWTQEYMFGIGSFYKSSPMPW